METEDTSEDWQQIEKLIPKQVPELRKILKEKYDIVVPAHCDDLIARCIRMKDGDLENALILLRQYHTTTCDIKDWDAIMQPSLEAAIYKAGKLMFLLQRDSDGRRIFICRVGMWEPATMTFEQAMFSVWMPIQYVTAVSKETQRNGIVAICDYRGYSMKHVWATNNWRIPYMARIVQNGIAGRIKEFHVINHPKFFSVLYSTFIRPFLKDKFKKRVTFHDNIETLHSRFDKNALPIFAGGTREIAECMDLKLMNEFLSQDQYFIGNHQSGSILT